MDRMSEFESAGNDKLNRLLVQYRDACPDVDASSDFMPNLWQKIEARRVETTGLFRRLAQICVAATAILALLITGVLMPASSASVFDSTSYVDVLAADHLSSDYAVLLPAGDDAR
jgi:hypothetical protein